MEAVTFQRVSLQNVLLKHPFSMVLLGPSGCGKTRFILNFIEKRHLLTDTLFDRVIYSYKIYQKAFDPLVQEGVEFVEGENFTLDRSQRTLLIIDDQTASACPLVADLFTVQVHHGNVSCIYVTHNLFHNDPNFRMAMLSAHYLILFKSIRNVGQVHCLARQLFSHDKVKSKRMVGAYDQATRKAYGYLLIDLTPTCPDIIRLRTEVLREGAKFLGEPLIKTFPL